MAIHLLICLFIFQLQFFSSFSFPETIRGSCYDIIANLNSSQFLCSSVLNEQAEFAAHQAKMIKLIPGKEPLRAWCPARQISAQRTEWIDIDLTKLHVIHSLITRGLQRSNVDYYPDFIHLQYQREFNGDWFDYSFNKSMLISGNSDGVNYNRQSLPRTIVARRIKIFPIVSTTLPRLICLSVKLIGVPFNDGIVQYRAPAGILRFQSDLIDNHYDGGGMGKLLDNNLNSYLGWDSHLFIKKGLPIVLRFDGVYEIYSLRFYLNMESQSLRVKFLFLMKNSCDDVDSSDDKSYLLLFASLTKSPKMIDLIFPNKSIGRFICLWILPAYNSPKILISELLINSSWLHNGYDADAAAFTSTDSIVTHSTGPLLLLPTTVSTGRNDFYPPPPSPPSPPSLPSQHSQQELLSSAATGLLPSSLPNSLETSSTNNSNNTKVITLLAILSFICFLLLIGMIAIYFVCKWHCLRSFDESRHDKTPRNHHQQQHDPSSSHFHPQWIDFISPSRNPSGQHNDVNSSLLHHHHHNSQNPLVIYQPVISNGSLLYPPMSSSYRQNVGVMMNKDEDGGSSSGGGVYEQPCTLQRPLTTTTTSATELQQQQQYYKTPLLDSPSQNSSSADSTLRENPPSAVLSSSSAAAVPMKIFNPYSVNRLSSIQHHYQQPSQYQQQQQYSSSPIASVPPAPHLLYTRGLLKENNMQQF